ncbi:hypothetical protein HKCCE2091_04065 [Rhodobacterales bacterium HKCCE2091]|nr:hypothetical protein [Rhodobacterales bacterium HKCCE2091]
MIELESAGSRLLIDPEVGNYPLWEVGGRSILHAAPWRDEPDVQASDLETKGLRRLAGDLFCMPFCADDGDAPLHGWPANSEWRVIEATDRHADLRLVRDVKGAEVTKRVRIEGPVFYQVHEIAGGAGEITFAHHPMARMAAGGRLSFSAKRAAVTDPKPQYAGHNLWVPGQVVPDLRLACEDGSMWDLHEYPAGHAVEDFAILVEAHGSTLGWTVLMRNAEDDMVVVLKDPRVLPVTMLWISNGGRDFAPWNNRHTGVIGIEDGLASGALGLAHAKGENPVKSLGAPTTAPLGGRHVVRHAMIALPRPPGWSRVTGVAVENGEAVLTEAGGDRVSVPFDADFFPD